MKRSQKRDNILLNVYRNKLLKFASFEVQPNGQLVELDSLSSKDENIEKRNKGKKARRLTGQSKAAITRSYVERYPEQRKQVLDRIAKLSKIDPKLADQYRDNLQSILLQGRNELEAARLAERKLETVTQKLRARKPNSKSQLLTDLEQEAQDAKVARKLGRLAGKGELVRRGVVGAEPTEIVEAKGTVGTLKQLAKRFTEGTSFGRFIEREIKRVPVITSQPLTRREFNKQAAKTLAIGTTAIAKLPQEVTELGTYAFNGVLGNDPIEALIKGTQKAVIDTVQAGMTVLMGGQLTPEAKKEVEEKLAKLGKQYDELVDKLPQWAKDKYAEIDQYKLSRRQLLTGQLNKGKKVTTIDVPYTVVDDIWDQPLPPSSRLLQPKPKPKPILALPPARSPRLEDLFPKKSQMKSIRGELVPTSPMRTDTSRPIDTSRPTKASFLSTKRSKLMLAAGLTTGLGLSGYAGYKEYKKRQNKK